MYVHIQHAELRETDKVFTPNPLPRLISHHQCQADPMAQEIKQHVLSTTKTHAPYFPIWSVAASVMERNLFNARESGKIGVENQGVCICIYPVSSVILSSGGKRWSKRWSATPPRISRRLPILHD